ncbi:MAG TPA: protein kinase [Rudaea sp.]|jgi:serine/threonine-protein kinase
MDTARWDLAGNIFERLLGAPQGERSDMLETLCGDDAELKNIVVSMLESEDSADRFERQLERASPKSLETTTEMAVEQGEVQVGPWRLVGKLGTGGMGVVWLAERADGQFEQRAALKLIKRGMDSEAVLKRFLRERQILARLDHAHIAHLLDGGIAADGRPYFAMEYVEGLPLLRYCHERGVKLEERLKFFIDVCAAVQFAHEHHVVHRDLKPSNILVTEHAGVKLLDFGIAKLLDTDDSSPDAITHLQRERPMTPAYAAPEQIRGEKITEATDIYALGCVLYELLTGKRSYNFSGANEPKDVLSIIESADPVAPSRLKLAAPPLPQRQMRGDLDTIVLTALRREPARRYGSVAALAADLQNFLTGNPISARRDSLFYRGWKFVRRHRTGLAAAVAVAAIGVATLSFELRDRSPLQSVPQGTSMAIVDFNNLSQNADSAWLTTALSEMLATELATGGKVHVLPDELVRSARSGLAAPLAGGYALKSLATLRKRLGADYILSGSYLVGGGSSEPILRLDLALQDTRSGVARATFAQSGPLADLSTLVEKAGATLREKSGFAPALLDNQQRTDKAQPPNTEVARRMALAVDALRKYDPARAKDELLQALVLAPAYAPAYAYLAQAWKALGYDEKALASAQQAAAHAGNLPPGPRLQIERQVAIQKRQWPEALTADQGLLALDPKNLEFHLGLIDDLQAAGQQDAADAELTKVRSLPGADDPRVELKAADIAGVRNDPKGQSLHAQRALASAQQRDEPALAAQAKRLLGIALDLLGESEKAEAILRESIADFQRSENPKGEAGARTSLAIVLAGKNQPQPARDEYERALNVFQRIGDQNGLAAIYANMVNPLWDHGDRDAAEAAAKKVLEIRRETSDLAGQAWALLVIAQLQLDENASDATLDTYRQAIALDERAGQRAHHLSALNKYSEALQLRGDLDAARDVCKQAQADASRSTNPRTGIGVDLRCAVIALDRGDKATFVAGANRAVDLARDHDDKDTAAYAGLALARLDMANRDFPAAEKRLSSAIRYFADGEVVPDEAEAQALAALCYAALGRKVERDRAAGRAKELRSAITIRGSAAVVDTLLARLLADDGQPRQAALRLVELADDAAKRQWIARELEARLAAIPLLEQIGDASAAAQRKRVETTARQHGFGWVLDRLNSTLPG